MPDHSAFQHLNLAVPKSLICPCFIFFIFFFFPEQFCLAAPVEMLPSRGRAESKHRPRQPGLPWPGQRGAEACALCSLECQRATRRPLLPLQLLHHQAAPEQFNQCTSSHSSRLLASSKVLKRSKSICCLTFKLKTRMLSATHFQLLFGYRSHAFPILNLSVHS